MASTEGLPGESSTEGVKPRPTAGNARILVGGLCLVVLVAVGGYALLNGIDPSMIPFMSGPAATENVAEPSDRSTSLSKPEPQLTRESVDLLLDAFDQAMRQKEIDGILRHIAPDATITIHMTQGTQQQSATLTREEYGKSLAMGFAFPSANNFTRVDTTVSLAPDGRSAKVSFRSTETLLQAQRELTIEGEATLVVKIRDDKPVITSLEQVVPGDST
jgi:hypothetical protein